MLSGDGSVDFGDDRLQFPSKDLVQLAPGCSLPGEDRQVVNVLSFHEKVLGQVLPDEFQPFFLFFIEAAIRFQSL